MIETKKEPALWQALFPIGVLVLLLFTNVSFFGSDATLGSNQVAMVIASGVAAIISFNLGFSWKEIEHSIVKSISSAMGAILILMVIGALSGTWLISGIVPAMIYYGLKILNPTIFLFAACIVSCIVSLATGSSWSTIATVGIALLGIGKTLGISEPVIAGAIISGAYFGDKMSPLSDTTNLAPAMAGTDLFTHIKYMMYTTIPTLIITLVIFFIWGFTLNSTVESSETEAVMKAIDSAFNLNPLLFVVPIAVLVMIIKKMPALPALLIGSLLGGVATIIFQPQIVNQISSIDGNFLKSSFIAVMKAMAINTSIQTDNAMISELLSSKGMY
ncbi:MAG TPA: Na+/H+ antiporter NhaC family protein, partial [Sediminibacterium sp.]|nr:Na+/H+ antiporter NhaC family protein [Sediminibacterium sp.]